MTHFDPVQVLLTWTDFLFYLLEVAVFYCIVLLGIACFEHCKSRR